MKRHDNKNYQPSRRPDDTTNNNNNNISSSSLSLGIPSNKKYSTTSVPPPWYEKDDTSYSSSHYNVTTPTTTTTTTNKSTKYSIIRPNEYAINRKNHPLVTDPLDHHHHHRSLDDEDDDIIIITTTGKIINNNDNDDDSNNSTNTNTINSCSCSNYQTRYLRESINTIITTIVVWIRICYSKCYYFWNRQRDDDIMSQQSDKIKKWIVIIVCIIGGFICCYILLGLLWSYSTSFVDYNIPDTKVIRVPIKATTSLDNNTTTGSSDTKDQLLYKQQTVTYRHPEKLHKINFQTQQDEPTTPYDGIYEGQLTLIDIQLLDDSSLLYTNESIPYSGIQATFCYISWYQQSDPNKQQQQQYATSSKSSSSSLCQRTKVQVADFNELVTNIKLYDQYNKDHQQVSSSSKPLLYTMIQQSIPTAVIFHESYSGSSVVSTILANVPQTSRMYVEPEPIIKALQVCSTTIITKCDSQAQIRLVQDLFYIMGRFAVRKQQRSNNNNNSNSKHTVYVPPPKYVFYKLPSMAVSDIEIFTKAMPTTPWVFLYRNSVEVMMSHFLHAGISNQNMNHPSQLSSSSSSVKISSDQYKTIECLQNYKEPIQPELFVEIVVRANRTVASLQPEEYCAAYIAMLAQSAIYEYNEDKLASTSSDQLNKQNQRSSWFLNYNQLPYIIWEQWLPELLRNDHFSVSSDVVTELHKVATAKQQKVSTTTHHHGSTSAGTSSKTTTKESTTVEHWVDDSKRKQNLAPTSVQRAAEIFLDPLYIQMERIRENQQ